MYLLRALFLSVCNTKNFWDMQIVWKRASELSSKPALFYDDAEDESGDGGAEANDIIQGTLGDCYLLSSLAILCTSKGLGLIEKLFVCQEYFSQGLVGMRFFKEGMWWDVAIDTFVPCNAAYNPPMPIFGRCVKMGGRVLWTVANTQHIYQYNTSFSHSLTGSRITWKTVIVLRTSAEEF